MDGHFSGGWKLLWDAANEHSVRNAITVCIPFTVSSFFAVQVLAVGFVFGALHVVAHQGQGLAVLALRGRRQHHDRPLVAFRGDVDGEGVVAHGQIGADPVNHTRNGFDFRAQRELQFLDHPVIVLARVQHRPRLVFALGKVHQVFG